MTGLLRALAVTTLLSFELAATAGDLPNEIESVNYGSPREALVTFGANGRCAMKVGGDWVTFSKDRDANIHQELGLGVSDVLKRPKQVARLVGVVTTIGLRDPENPGRVDTITLAPSRRRDGVPLYLADFVSRACVIESYADLDNLARVRELPVRVRQRIVQLMSIAAFRRYNLDSSPMSHDSPRVNIPHWASRCAAVGLYCDRWAVSVSRGFDGRWTP